MKKFSIITHGTEAEREVLAKEEPRGTHLEDGVKDELAEGPGQFLSIRAGGRFAEFASGRVKVSAERRKSGRCPCSDTAQGRAIPWFPLIQLPKCDELLLNQELKQELKHNHTLLPFSHPLQCQPAATRSCSAIPSSPVSPQLLHHVLDFLGPLGWAELGISLGSKLCHVHLSKLLEGEGPAVQARAKAHGPEHRVNLGGNSKAGSGEQPSAHSIPKTLQYRVEL